MAVGFVDDNACSPPWPDFPNPHISAGKHCLWHVGHVGQKRVRFDSICFRFVQDPRRRNLAEYSQKQSVVDYTLLLGWYGEHQGGVGNAW